MTDNNLLVLLTALVSVALGLFIYLRPLDVFEIQRRFYRLINWNIEPISLSKEIRNTKIMGLFLIVFSVGAVIYAFIRK